MRPIQHSVDFLVCSTCVDGEPATWSCTNNKCGVEQEQVDAINAMHSGSVSQSVVSIDVRHINLLLYISKTRSPSIGWTRQKNNAAPLKFDPKRLEVAFSAVFPNFYKCRPEVAGDDIPGVAIE